MINLYKAELIAAVAESIKSMEDSTPMEIAAAVVEDTGLEYLAQHWAVMEGID